MRTHRIASTLFISALVLAGCTTPSAGTNASTSADSAAPAPLSTALTSPASAGDLPGNGVEGTVVRFSGGGTSVEVTPGADTPTTRDFVSLLPFTTQLEEFAGREKIGDLPRALNVQGTPGSTPRTATSSTSPPGATSASTTTPPASATPSTPPPGHLPGQ